MDVLGCKFGICPADVKTTTKSSKSTGAKWIYTWLVVSTIFYVHSYLGKMNPIWRAYFSNGLVQPPTRYKYILYLYSIMDGTISPEFVKDPVTFRPPYTGGLKVTARPSKIKTTPCFLLPQKWAASFATFSDQIWIQYWLSLLLLDLMYTP